MIQRMAKLCAEKEGGTQSDIDDAIENKVPTTHVGKCMLACIGEMSDVVSNLARIFSFNHILITFIF